MNLHTKVTDGNYWIDCVEPSNKPIKATNIDPNFIMDTDVTFKPHRYVLTDVNLMGVVRRFYVSQSLSPVDAQRRIGLFLANLMDIYIES